MASLSSHTNVYNTCLRILRQRGYRLWVEGELDHNVMYPNDLAWMAEKNGKTFQADNPIELLGLAAIYEYVNPVGETQPDWWTVPGANIKDELLAAAFPDEE
jgi:hypothetical protein